MTKSDGSTKITTIEQWRPREERNVADFTAYVMPKKTELMDKEQIVKDITKEQHQMRRYDEEHLEFLWKVRNSVDKHMAYKWRQVLWTELERRYEVPRKPIEIKIPYMERIDIVKVKGMITQAIAKQKWPEYLKEWHRRSLRVVTGASRSIEDIMVNVTKPKWIPRGCKCQELRKTCPKGAMIDGHVLMIGREFEGDEGKAMRICASNVPRATWGDVFRVWSDIRRQLPEEWRMDESEWKKELFKCTKKVYGEATIGHRTKTAGRYTERELEVPTTKEVYELRKRIRGMVVGPLDKNKGELCVACPVLYHKALKKAYSADTGYQPVFIAKMSQYRKQRYDEEELPNQILRSVRVKDKRQKGSEQDITKMFARIYKKRGWDEYAKFNMQGGLGVPYVLFKAKNMIDQKTRKLKWTKVRPIAPGTKHPMKKLLHYVGRAWSFVTTQVPGDHLVINKTSEVPKFLKEASELAKYGDIKMKVYDIEGCYPNMPKATIRRAMRDILEGYNGVYVPKFSDAQPCAWSSKKQRVQKLPFHVMIDVLEFALDFAIIKMPSGQVLRQMDGIPMGDPLSPGMTIGTCAWMENEWLKSIAQTDRKYFRMKRFMDDILMVYAQNSFWDSEKFVDDFVRSECYEKPLKLEEGKDGIFLETQFWTDGRTIGHKLKNDNADGGNKVWRYHHWYGNSSFMQKRATLTACLRKVQHMASDPEQLRKGALDKIAEFRRLHYPCSVLRKACNFLGASTGEGMWITVRNVLR